MKFVGVDEIVLAQSECRSGSKGFNCGCYVAVADFEVDVLCSFTLFM